nr:uncharacterized protein LOC127347807 [Lolium perenne]
MIGALLRKFWPGKYYPLGTVPAGEMKLATTWTDYESAPGVGFPTAAEAVMRKFWCFYRVAPEVEEAAANRTLRATCERLTPQVWYNQRITSAGHFWAERGERVHKPDIVGKNAKAEYEMTVEDYMSVIPDWAEPHAEAWEEMVRTRWLKMDEDFAAVARRNAENRGDGGTHRGGNLGYERYKGKTPDFEAAYVVAHQEYQVAFNQAPAALHGVHGIYTCVDGGQSNWTDSGFRADASLSGAGAKHAIEGKFRCGVLWENNGNGMFRKPGWWEGDHTGSSWWSFSRCYTRYFSRYFSRSFSRWFFRSFYRKESARAGV